MRVVSLGPSGIVKCLICPHSSGHPIDPLVGVSVTVCSHSVLFGSSILMHALCSALKGVSRVTVPYRTLTQHIFCYRYLLRSVPPAAFHVIALLTTSFCFCVSTCPLASLCLTHIRSVLVPCLTRLHLPHTHSIGILLVFTCTTLMVSTRCPCAIWTRLRRMQQQRTLRTTRFLIASRRSQFGALRTSAPTTVHPPLWHSLVLR